jgi:hypothetical protein
VATEIDFPDRGPSRRVLSSAVAPLVVAAVGDPTGERTVSAIVALLVVLGIGLIMLAVWLFRVTRPDPEVLAPLELMGQRAWRRGDPVWQRRRLDEVRPPGAEPLQPSVAPPEIDAAFDDGPTASGFDDLHEPTPTVPGDPLVAGLPGSLPAPDRDATTGILRDDAGAAAGGPRPPTAGDWGNRPRVVLLPPPDGPSAVDPAPVTGHDPG